MTAVIDTQLEDLFRADAPRLTATDTAALFGVQRGTVLHAIRTGKLPAEHVGSGKRAAVWLIRPRDAMCIWGHRLRENTTA